MTGADSDLMSQYLKVAPIAWGLGGDKTTALMELARSRDLHMREDGQGQSLKTQPHVTKQDG